LSQVPKDDWSGCVAYCKKESHGELLVWFKTDAKLGFDPCRCPDGKYATKTPASDAKCNDCIANSKSATDITKCVCKEGFYPAWTTNAAGECSR